MQRQRRLPTGYDAVDPAHLGTPMPDTPPFPLGAFTAHRLLARGGTASVWEGVHGPTGVPVALKVLDRQASGAANDALRTEIEAAAALSHPHILVLFDHGTVHDGAAAASRGRVAPGQPWLAMELARGGTLDPGAVPDWDAVRAVLDALLDALSHAHAHGVIHRDLKPSNLLLAGPDDLRPGLKVGDFGIASAAQDRFRRRVAGTPRYMAPEQSRAAWRDLGPWTDLYALGGVAWELVTGSPPFGSGDRASLAHRHQHEPPPPLFPRFDVPEGLDGWLRRSLAKSNLDRFPTAADARWALDQLGPATRPASPGAGIAWPGATDDDTLVGLLADHPGDPSTNAHPTTPGPRARVDTAPAPVPRDWHLPDAPEASPQLAGAGLALYGLRQIPLVGRSFERTVLWDALRSVALQRRPRVVILEGPAGVGKSALARWLVERVHETGAATPHTARHEPGGGASHALRSMLVQVTGLDGLTQEQAVDRLHGWLQARHHADPDDARTLAAWLVPAAGDPPPFASSAARLALLLRVLRTLSADRPAVVWLDDVVWGPGTLEFVEHVMQAADPPPVLFAMTVQREALADLADARAQIDALRTRADVVTLPVAPMAFRQVRRLVRRLLPLREALADTLAARVDGNPLFAVQLLGDWIQRGLLTTTDDGFDLRPGAAPPLPDDLHQVWSARLDRVLTGPLRDGRDALEIAAVLGGTVRLDAWHAAVRAAGVPLPDGLVAALVRARLASEDDGVWRFAHGMVRESIQRGARESGRWAAAHAAAAAMLATQPGTDALARRGSHLVEAGAVAEGADRLLDAASDRTVREEHRAATDVLARAEEALELLDAPDDDLRRARWRLLAARVACARRDLERADDLARRAAEVARAHHDAARLAEALTERANVARARGDLPRARAALIDALDAWRGVGAGRGLADALRQLADVEMHLGDAAAATEAVHEALRLSRHLGDRVGTALGTLLVGDLARARSAWDAARDAYTTGLAMLRAEGHRSGIADGMAGLAEVHRFTGALAEAEHGYREAARLDETLGRDASVSRLNLALCLIARDQPRDALPILEQLEQTWAATGRPGYLAVLHVATLPCLAATGRWTAWRRHQEQAAVLLEQSAFVDVDVAQLAEHAGRIARDAGRPDEARAAWAIARAQWLALGDGRRAGSVQRAVSRLATPSADHGDPS